MKHWQPEKKVLLIALVLYLPFLFLGYGSDMDTYNVLWAGKNFAQTLDYVPSRGPGFFVFETVEYFANQAGGSLLTNLTVMGMSLVMLYGFMRLCREFHVQNAALLGVILAIHPYLWVNSTCTDRKSVV
jgi:folate-dependent phosphoribosylglycinamide formyltransferase PurN